MSFAHPIALLQGRPCAHFEHSDEISAGDSQGLPGVGLQRQGVRSLLHDSAGHQVGKAELQGLDAALVFRVPHLNEFRDLGGNFSDGEKCHLHFHFCPTACDWCCHVYYTSCDSLYTTMGIL